MPEPLNVYRSTLNGVTRKLATRGSRFDRRLARSARWALVEGAAAEPLPDDREVASSTEPEEPTTAADLDKPDD